MAFASAFTGLSLRTAATQCGLHAVCETRASVADGGDDAKERWSTGKVRAPRQMRGASRSWRGRVRTQGKRYRPLELAPVPPGLRVAAGSARGRRLISPEVYMRPMMGKVREALYSMLGTLDVVRPDGTVLDLFAGSGSVGLEALSRGMGRAVFVDGVEECSSAIRQNLELCKFGDRGTAVTARVENFLNSGTRYNNDRHYDLITITPPYEEVDYGILLDAVIESNCVGEGTFVVVEYPVEMKSLPPAINQRLVGIRNRRYGRTVLAVYACQPDSSIDPRPEEFIDVSR